MKRKTPYRYFWKAAFSLTLFTFFTGTEILAQTSTTFSQPGNSMNYTHDGTNWVHKTNSTFTYNAAGQKTEELQQDALTNQNTIRLLYTYDSFGNWTSQETYKWLNSAWALTNSGRDSIVYFSGNKKSKVYSKVLNNNIWENYMLIEYAYDTNNYLIEESYADWDTLTSAWQPHSKTTFTNDANGIITQKQFFDYVNNAWVLNRTNSNFTWHTPNILPATYDISSPNSLYPRRSTTTLGANGGYVTLQEYYYTPTNTWRNSLRDTRVADFRGNITSFKGENYPNNQWQVLWEWQYAYTYNSQFDITEKIERWPNYSLPNGPATDKHKYIYSNFQYFTRALGTSEIQKTALNLTVYPNPATNKIQIELTDNKPQALTATLSDITGKTWQTQTFKAAEAKQLNIEGLPKGVYLLQLQTEAGSTVKRVVKQ